MAKKKHSKKPLDFQEILQILARNSGGPGKVKGKGKNKLKRNFKNAPVPNYDPCFDEPELGSFENTGKFSKQNGSIPNKKGPAKRNGLPQISFIPSSSKHLQEEVRAKGFKQGGDRKKRGPEFNAPINPNGVGIKYCYDSDIESVTLDLKPGCSKDHAVIIKNSSEDELGETSDEIADQEESSDEHMDECENFRIDIMGDPSQKPLSTEARQVDDGSFISFGGTCDVNSAQARKSHHQEAMQDYMANISVENVDVNLYEDHSFISFGETCDVNSAQARKSDHQQAMQDYMDSISIENLDMKLKEVQLSQDSDDSMSYGSLNDSDMASLLGSEPSEEWAEGFKDGLQTALDLLPKFAKKILTNELKACVDKSLLPSSIAPKPKAKKTPQGFDKKPNEDRRHSTTVKGSSLHAANEAILEMLNNPHRKQIQFPLISKPHRQSIISLSELYNLEIITPRIKQHPLCVLKPDSVYSLPSADEVNALIGIMPGSPMSKPSPQKKAKTGAVVCSSAPPIAASNIGHRLLSQMGWTPGQALGAAGDGILDPIQAEIRKKRQGLGS